MRKFFVFSLFVILSLVIFACSPQAQEVVSEPEAVVEEAIEEKAEEMAEEMPKSIVDIAVEDGRFTTLVTALTEAELVKTLQGEGPFTVFAPTDEAFAALPDGTIEALLADIPTLTDILLYHVVAGKVMAAEVVELDAATTVQGQDVAISTDMDKVMVNEAEVIITDIEASNGVIHVIDAVILPPSDDEMAEEMPKTIVDIAVEDGRFTTLVTALTEAELVETLQGEGPFTVFAPTDDAFAALPEGTIEALLADIPALTDILLYHVVAGKVMAADVVELDAATTVQGQDVAISTDMGKVMVNKAEVIITDIEASNGVIHVIDAVILPPGDDEMAEEMPKTIVDIAVEDGRFTTLVTALTEAELVETLQGDGPFTVFAPTDDAFAALPEGTIEALLADIPALTDILLYHVVAGKVMAADVVDLDAATTVQGQDVAISTDMVKVMVNGAEIIITDIEASNGVIHVIDSVLLLP